MNKVESLIIYKEYFYLILYTENILVKYPKIEKLSLVSNIKNNTYRGIELIIRSQKEYDKKIRLKLLNEIDVNLKMLKVLIRLSYKKKYINKRNYASWSKKITNIGNLLGGWINSCLKQ